MVYSMLQIFVEVLQVRVGKQEIIYWGVSEIYQEVVCWGVVKFFEQLVVEIYC